MKDKNKITILGYRISIKTYTGNTYEETLRNGSATVFIRGWNYDDKIPVKFDSRDSNEFIACKAASMSEVDWKWPWWKFSANRKLKYLKKNGGKQLWLEK